MDRDRPDYREYMEQQARRRSRHGRLDAESRVDALRIEVDDLRTALVEAAVDRRDLDAGVPVDDVPPCPVCGERWCWGLPVRPGSVCRAYCDRHDRQLGLWLVRAADGDVVALPAGRMPHRQRAWAAAEARFRDLVTAYGVEADLRVELATLRARIRRLAGLYEESGYLTHAADVRRLLEAPDGD